MQIIFYLAFIALMLVTAYYDLTSLTIPNWISIAVAVSFFAFSIIIELSWAEIGYRTLCGGLFLIGGFFLFYFGLFGGGDVKILAASMLWIGFERAVPFLIYMSFLGAAIAIVKSIWLFFSKREASFQERIKQALRAEIPYGVAIVGAALIVLPVPAFA